MRAQIVGLCRAIASALMLVAGGALAQPPCPGDCDGDRATSSDDLALALRAAFSTAPVDCAAADLNGDGMVTAAELLRVRIAIAAPPAGCTVAPTATATATSTNTLSFGSPTPTSTMATVLTATPTPSASLPPGTPRSTWIALTPLPGGPRQEVGVAALDRRVYVIGGFTDTGGGSAVVEVYDTTANGWDRMANLPAQRNHVGAAAVSGNVYVVGGFVGSGFTPASDVYRYDPSADQWEPVAALPEPRGALAVAELGGKLYASGGSGPGGSVTTHTVYDPGANTWAELAALPNPRNHLAAVALGSALYVIGGRHDGSGSVNTDELDRYDPDADRWTMLAPMPTARSGIAAAVLAGRIVVMGGEVNLANPPTYVFPQVEIYEPSSNTWTAIDPMAVPRHGIGAATVGDLIYVPGGAKHAGFDATAESDALQIFF